MYSVSIVTDRKQCIVLIYLLRTGNTESQKGQTLKLMMKSINDHINVDIQTKQITEVTPYFFFFPNLQSYLISLEMILCHSVTFSFFFQNANSTYSFTMTANWMEKRGSQSCCMPIKPTAKR